MNAENINYWFNVRALKALDPTSLEKILSEWIKLVSPHFSKESMRIYAEQEHKRFVFWSRASLAALIPEFILLPFIVQYTTSVETGLYVALFPTTAAAYQYAAKAANVFDKLLRHVSNSN